MTHRRIWFYVWLIPAAWTVGVVLMLRHPGDANAAVAVSAMPGLWVHLVPGLAVEEATLPGLAWVLLVGGLVLAAGGAVMDLLRVRWWVWLHVVLLIAVVVCGLRMQEHHDFVERRLARRPHARVPKLGHIQMINVAANVGLYGSVPLCIVVAAGRGGWRRIRSPGGGQARCSDHRGLM